MAKAFVVFAAISGLLSVALGAFGAHGLKSVLSDSSLDVYKTAALYQITHSLALLLVGIMLYQLPTAQLLKASGLSFIIGIVLFSGSLYILSITNIKILGAITPLGGVAFILGWAMLAVSAYQSM